MEITEDFINALELDESAIIRKMSFELGIGERQVGATVALFKEGNTIPFISRYRKEMTGSLDETQVRDISHRLAYLENLETRKIEVARNIFGQGKLTDELYKNIQKCIVMTELEDLYAPYKKKKKTRGMLAIEKGLEGLADDMLSASNEEIEALAANYIDEEKGVLNSDEAIQGAMDIIAERFSQDMDKRKECRGFVQKFGEMKVVGKGDPETSVYKMYYDYNEPIRTIKDHRILAINRGEKAGELSSGIDYDMDVLKNDVESRIKINNVYHKMAVEDSLKRLLMPSVMREIRSELTEQADTHSIGLFSTNLKNLLLAPPIKRTRVLGVDPGIRTGTKCAALDENGKYLSDFKIYQNKVEDSKRQIADCVKKYSIKLIAVGNGTGSHDVQEVVAEAITEYDLDAQYTVVAEDGASVYSASVIAREEFPNLDLTIRGAISIGRRLQDPLSELVKIDPQSIGVGQYQHDVNQKQLSETLDEVVESVVNNVGVNINNASFSLLKYVSGVTTSVAKHIVEYRDENGTFTSRKDIKKVSGMGDKTFEQAAGFLMIPESKNPLDNSWVHPENYSIAEDVAHWMENGKLEKSKKKEISDKYEVGKTTLNDIISELQKPGRDPREDYPMPIMQKGVIGFEDLKVGMKVKGKIKNVVDFGAFVDIGIKESALLHISQMSDSYVNHPTDVVKVGDVVECAIIEIDSARKRISLSRKSQH